MAPYTESKWPSQTPGHLTRKTSKTRAGRKSRATDCGANKKSGPRATRQEACRRRSTCIPGLVHYWMHLLQPQGPCTPHHRACFEQIEAGARLSPFSRLCRRGRRSISRFGLLPWQGDGGRRSWSLLGLLSFRAVSLYQLGYARSVQLQFRLLILHYAWALLT